ncbi:MAG TPA: CvpA family protein [Candidatus Acidoferrales bacterium]|nr:CvpA family protein [Candidatus Acidoferrales bacterium]
MSLFDVISVLLLVGYGVLGFFSGLVRRVLGLVGVFVAALVATNFGQVGGSILRQEFPSLPVSDSRGYTWFFLFIALVVVFEILAALVHRDIQFTVIALNRGSGALAGLLTGLVVITSAAYVLGGLSQTTGPAFGALESAVHSSLSNSRFGLPLAERVGPAILPPLTGALPRDPAQYFELPDSA